jgi:hypothetical protein
MSSRRAALHGEVGRSLVSDSVKLERLSRIVALKSGEDRVRRFRQ